MSVSEFIEENKVAITSAVVATVTTAALIVLYHKCNSNKDDSIFILLPESTGTNMPGLGD